MLVIQGSRKLEVVNWSDWWWLKRGQTSQKWCNVRYYMKQFQVPLQWRVTVVVVRPGMSVQGDINRAKPPSSDVSRWFKQSQGWSKVFKQGRIPQWGCSTTSLWSAFGSCAGSPSPSYKSPETNIGWGNCLEKTQNVVRTQFLIDMTP